MSVSLARAALLCLVAVALGCASDGETQTVTVTQTSGAMATTTEQPAVPAGPKTEGFVGETVTSTDDLNDPPETLEIRLVKFERRATPSDPGIAQTLLESDNRSTAKWEWARLRVSVRNAGEARAVLLGEGFELIDENDQRYEGLSVSPGGVFEPDAAGENLQPGDRIRGYIAVAVPKTAKVRTIRYSTVTGGGTVIWFAPSE